MGVKLLVLAAAAVMAPQALPVGELPSYRQPAKAWSDLETAAAEDCPAPVVEASATARPRIDREPERGDTAKAIRAVDSRIDGCPVLVRMDGRIEAAPGARPADTATRLK